MVVRATKETTLGVFLIITITETTITEIIIHTEIVVVAPE
jgi:hypothetical protein